MTGEDEDFGGMFGMFDDDEDVPTDAGLFESPSEVLDQGEVAQPVVLDRDETCPIPKDTEIKGMPISVRTDEDDLSHPARVLAFEAASGTYAIVWRDSGMAQYGVSPEKIDWTKSEQVDESEKKTVVIPQNIKDELWLAARRGSMSSVVRFVEVEMVPITESGSEQERTPFYWAVFAGHVSVAEYLLDKGATDPDGVAFVSTTKPEMLELLTSRGWSKTGFVVQEETAKMRRRSSAAVRRKSVMAPPPSEPSQQQPLLTPPAAPVNDKKLELRKEEPKRGGESLVRRVLSAMYGRLFGGKSSSRSKTIKKNKNKASTMARD